ncbi:MAG: hypothetical protein RLZZ224_55, partial [Verrucomicrobiota bacterium]
MNGGEKDDFRRVGSAFFRLFCPRVLEADGAIEDRLGADLVIFGIGDKVARALEL